MAAGPGLVERAERRENRRSRARNNGWLVAGRYIGDYGRNWLARAVVARTALGDLRSHAKTWDMLRRTRMPAVRIDAGYLTNPRDAALLADPAFRDVFAEAVVVAVQRVYLDPEQDAKTGVLRLSELRAAVRQR